MTDFRFFLRRAQSGFRRQGSRPSADSWGEYIGCHTEGNMYEVLKTVLR
jgi:hypothetical protein